MILVGSSMFDWEGVSDEEEMMEIRRGVLGEGKVAVGH